MSWFLYLLENTENKRTYLGVTTDYVRRIRQHNGEIKGGAKYTKNFKGGGNWELILFVDDLTKSKALSVERTVKNMRRRGKGKTPRERRIFLIKKFIEKNKIKWVKKDNIAVANANTDANADDTINNCITKSESI